MPQMSPMWWMTLMLMFNIMLVMTNSIMYFNFKSKMMSNKMVKKMKFQWKW